MDVVILASGSGTTFEAIRERCQNITIRALITDRESKVFDKGWQGGTPSFRCIHDQMGMFVRMFNPGIVILAGYMRILPPSFVNEFNVINTHPSLLPKYPGLDTYNRVLAAGDKMHGATVHWVDEGVDTGPIIAQTEFEILEGEDAASLEARTKAAEKDLYIATIDRLAEGRDSW